MVLPDVLAGVMAALSTALWTGGWAGSGTSAACAKLAIKSIARATVAVLGMALLRLTPWSLELCFTLLGSYSGFA